MRCNTPSLYNHDPYGSMDSWTQPFEEVSMIRKCQNHTLQTNARRREKETQARGGSRISGKGVIVCINQGSHTTGKTGKVRELDTGRSRP